MKIKFLPTVLLLAIATLNSCTKDNAKTTEKTMDVKTDSVIANPTNTTMDSATVEVKDATSQSSNLSQSKDAITLNSMSEGSTEKAYLVFNEDQSKAEILLPNEKTTTILERKGTEGNYTWTDGKLELIQWKGYVLRTLKQGTNLFAGDVAN